MRKWFIIAAALVAVGIPAAYAAVPNNEPASTAQGQDSDETAAKACKAELESMGAAAFRKKYGTNHNQMNAFGKCVSSRSKGNDDEAKDDDEDDKGADNTAKKCKAERKEIGAEAFAKKYGTNHNLRNAFGKCVSSKSKA
jgi:hypothetical protein